MKYRIKMILKNGNNIYIPQVKTFLGWDYVLCDRKSSWAYALYCKKQELAKQAIDKHYESFKERKEVAYEYITKP